MARRQNDAYYTEEGLTLELLKYLDLSQYKTALEPCVGDGHIKNVVQAKYPHLQYTTNDIDPTKEADYHCDASQYVSDLYLNFTKNSKKISNNVTATYIGTEEKTWDCCITNFPYNVQDQIVPLVWEHVSLLAFLCRITYLEPTRTRARFLQENAKHCRLQVIYNPRPRFDSKGTDSATSMFIVYDKNYNGLTQQVYATDWKENKL